MKDDEIRRVVREGYAGIARREGSCCTPANPCCVSTDAREISKKIGYGEEELQSVPEGANLGLGCGNPVALASISEGETVLDLGSGAGFDCFLAAQKVGASGKVIGVDMTPEMIEKARRNAQKGNYENVEFRLGEIEHLPVADNSVDVIISNCVINLSPDKKQVFREAFRVLKSGGRVMVSDMVLLKELPDEVKESLEAYVGCLSGAILKEEYLRGIELAGFQDVTVIDESTLSFESWANDPTAQLIAESFRVPQEKVAEITSAVVSIKVCGQKIGN
jgi:arsenite methyltransferase